MGKNICESEKYKLGGPQVDTIYLPVVVGSLPEKLEVNGRVLLLKEEFHVSLVCIGKIAEKHHVAIPDFVEKMVGDFCEFVQSTSVNFLRFREEYRSAEQNGMHSLVVMCDVSNLDAFFMIMNQKYGLNVEYPPTHVTLYTLPFNTGIFLTDRGDIEKLTTPVANPGLVLN